MSTRSSILIEVPDELIGKPFRYSSSKQERNWGNGTVDDMFQEVKLTKKYLGIYCHHDGCPNGVGFALVHGFNSFTEALNLILGGDCSSIESDNIRRYATRKSERWEYIQPRQLDRIERVSSDSEYLYIFMKGQWYLIEDDHFIPLFSKTKNYEDYIQGYLIGFEAGESFSQALRQLDLENE